MANPQGSADVAAAAPELCGEVGETLLASGGGTAQQKKEPSPKCLEMSLEKMRIFGGRELGPGLCLCYRLAALEQRYLFGTGFPVGLGQWGARPIALCPSSLPLLLSLQKQTGEGTMHGLCACKCLLQIPAV